MYSGSANRKRCATRKLSARTAPRRALTRATRRENPLRRPLTTESAADLAFMIRNTQYALLDYKVQNATFTQLSDATIHNRILSNAWERAFLRAPRTGPFFSAPRRSYHFLRRRCARRLERWAEHVEAIGRITFCDRSHMGCAGPGLLKVVPQPPTPKANMSISKTPSSTATSDQHLSAAERKHRRHKVAHRLYEALVAQDPNRAITLCDEAGNVLARHDPLPEHDAPEIASLTHVPTANGHDC
jgi:hypothetical protein